MTRLFGWWRRRCGHEAAERTATRWDGLAFCDPRNPFFDLALKPSSFEVSGEFDANLLHRLCATVASPVRLDRIEVRWHRLNSSSAGMCVPGDHQIMIGFHGDLAPVEPEFMKPQTDAMAWRIVANANQTPAERFVTLAHELGHIYCGHLGASRAPGDWPDARSVPRPIQEVEAEMVAALIGVHSGLNPGALLGVEERTLCAEAADAPMRRLSPMTIRRATERIALEAGLPALPDGLFAGSAGQTERPPWR